MKKLLLSLVLCVFSIQFLIAQIYGNTQHTIPTAGSSSNCGVAFHRILTGPNDSGFFTSLFIHDHIGTNVTDLKLALYSHSTPDDRPEHLLGHGEIIGTIDGEWNEVEF